MLLGADVTIVIIVVVALAVVIIKDIVVEKLTGSVICRTGQLRTFILSSRLPARIS